jgi:aminomethyltransferase
MSELNKTPLFDTHVSMGARMVPFAGFEMPVSYSGIIEEHAAVRERVGLFDVSHMGEFIVSGPDTWSWLNRVVTNNVERLPDDGVLYTVLCREDGTAVDDLLITRLSAERALIVVNASNIEKDFAHMSALVEGDVRLENHSDRWALFAVQGPQSRALLGECPSFAPVHDQLDGVGYYRYRAFESDGAPVILSRTGYTGELGFEVFVAPERAASLWNEIVERGESRGIRPVGLAARDTLRFEPGFCLYGHELDDDTTPLQAGLRWVVKFKKGDFVGREALLREKENGLAKQLVGLELEGRNIARQGYEVLVDGAPHGVITSGTFSPTLQKSLALAYLDGEVAGAERVEVAVRNKRVGALRVPPPFYPSRAASG